MATFRKRNNKWQVIVRHHSIGTKAQSFHCKSQAKRWAYELGNELERVNKRISEIDTAGKKILTSVTKVEKSINQLSLGILVTAILAIILVFVL